MPPCWPSLLLLIAISGSGNSPNILRAVDHANVNDMFILRMTGVEGGELLQSAQQSLHVASNDVGMVESVHLTLTHYILDTLYVRFKEATENQA